MKTKVKRKILAATIMLLVGAFFMPVGVLAQSQENTETSTQAVQSSSSPASSWWETTSDVSDQSTPSSDSSSSTTSELETTTSGSGQENPFTPDGQATVVDQATESDGKDFLTIKTPDGNEFFLVVDHQRNSDNVYFLNAVTEQDLIPLTKKEEKETIIPEVKLPEPTESTEPIPDPEEGITTGSKTKQLLIIFGVVGLMVVGGYYFKVIRPKQQAGEDLGEEYDEDLEETYDEDLGEEFSEDLEAPHSEDFEEEFVEDLQEEQDQDPNSTNGEDEYALDETLKTYENQEEGESN